MGSRNLSEISFSGGSLGNIPILEKILKSILLELNPRILLDYSDPSGLTELREEIVNLNKSKLHKENILITSSAQQALEIIFSYFQKEKRKIFLQEPGYFGTMRILKSKNFRIIPFKKVEEILPRIDRSDVVYLTSNFHNPTGETINPEIKKELAKIIVIRDALLIEDNPYDFIYFGKEKPTNILSLAPENTLHVGGFSKILGPGLRIGYIIANSKMIEKIKSEKITRDLFTSTVGQKICIEALDQAEYLELLRKYFKEKRDLVLNLLKEKFKDEKGFTWNKPEGGIFLLAQFSDKIESEKVLRIAKEKYALNLESDKYFYLDGKSRNSIRINFVQNSDTLLRKGINRLHQAIMEAKNDS